MFLKKLSGIIRSRCVNAKTTDASKTGAKRKDQGILRWFWKLRVTEQDRKKVTGNMGDYFVCSKTDPVVETKSRKGTRFPTEHDVCLSWNPLRRGGSFPDAAAGETVERNQNALAYGYVCPLLKQDEPNMEVLVPHRYWPQDEHCQNLNVWTQSLDPGAKKKPVMVWFHGGGFSAGSAIEHVAYEGIT